MADVIFNVVKGKYRYYTELPAANDALLLVYLEASGLEADATLVDYDDLATLLAGSSNEAAISRIVVTRTTTAIDDTNNRADVDMDDQTAVGATGNRVGAIVLCYDPDTTTGTDSSVIPLSKHDYVFTPDGNDVIVQIAAAGFFRST